MQEYGFIRQQTAGLATRQRPASSKRKPKAVVRELVGEALRMEGYTAHLKPSSIKEPAFLWGTKEELLALPEKLEHLKLLSEQISGKKVHSHTQLAIFGVASYPVPRLEVKKDDKRFLEWLKRVKNFIHKYFGEENLGPALPHADEPYLHIHFTVLPRLDLKTGKIHLPWLEGRLAYEADGPYAEATPKQKREIYKELMREFQDAFYEHVGKPMGWPRISENPRFRVNSLAEYKMRKAQGRLKKKPKKDPVQPAVHLNPPPVRRLTPF